MPRFPKRHERAGVDEYGRTPVWNLAFKGDADGVRRALEAGADPNGGDDAGHTPLMVAIQERHRDVVEVLVAEGAEINRRDGNGNTALSVLIRHFDVPTAMLLLQSGGDPTIENDYGISPYEPLAAAGDPVGAFVRTHFSD